MPRADAAEVVVGIVAIELRASEEQVRSARSFRGELGMDSIALANIVYALEEEYDCELAVEGVKRLDTVADLVRVLLDGGAAGPGR